MPSPDDTHLIEAAIRDRHVLTITYGEDETEQLTVEPLAIRFNSGHHRVLWVWGEESGHPLELLWDRIHAATDTGRGFEPRDWQEPPA